MPGIPEMDFRLTVSAEPPLLADAEAAADGLLAWAGADVDGAVVEVWLVEGELLEQALAASAMPAAQTAVAIQFLIMMLP
jgi:hypothetical protein